MKGTWIETQQGNIFDYTNFGPDDFDIEDIGAALSKIPRFLGHLDVFYSVAQHSIMVAEACPPELALVGLLHDAPEAYLGDLPTPLRRLPQMAGYNALHVEMWQAIAARWGLPQEIPPAVHLADWDVFKWEWFAFKSEFASDKWRDYGLALPPAGVSVEIIPLAPTKAQDLFIERFWELKTLWDTRTNELVHVGPVS